MMANVVVKGPNDDLGPEYVKDNRISVQPLSATSTNFVLILTGCALGFAYCQPVIYFSVCTQGTNKH